MADHPNAMRMRTAMERFMAGDMEGFLSTFSDDIVWRTGGANALTGTYRGKQEVGEWFGKLRELAVGTQRVEPLDLLADDEHLVVFLRLSAKRNGGSLDVKVANALRVDPDGKWAESWWLADDQKALDQFFS
jgi:uncharacterized protein